MSSVPASALVLALQHILFALLVLQLVLQLLDARRRRRDILGGHFVRLGRHLRHVIASSWNTHAFVANEEGAIQLVHLPTNGFRRPTLSTSETPVRSVSAPTNLFHGFRHQRQSLLGTLRFKLLQWGVYSTSGNEIQHASQGAPCNTVTHKHRQSCQQATQHATRVHYSTTGTERTALLPDNHLQSYLVLRFVRRHFSRVLDARAQHRGRQRGHVQHATSSLLACLLHHFRNLSSTPASHNSQPACANKVGNPQPIDASTAAVCQLSLIHI